MGGSATIVTGSAAPARGIEDLTRFEVSARLSRPCNCGAGVGFRQRAWAQLAIPEDGASVLIGK